MHVGRRRSPAAARSGICGRVLPEGEFLILTRYAAAAGRTKTDVVWELIRGLEQTLSRKARLDAKSARTK